VAHQAVDRLPLAAEPAAAALDLIIEFVSSGFTRTSAWRCCGRRSCRSARACRAGLWPVSIGAARKQYLGDIERLRRFVSDFAGERRSDALAAVVRAADALQPLTEPAPASTQWRPSLPSSPPTQPDAGARSARACSAIVDVLRSLARRARMGQCRDDRRLAPDIRRWIEEQTSSPTRAPPACICSMPRPRGSATSTPSRSSADQGEGPNEPGATSSTRRACCRHGWPSERDRRSASTAAFVDLSGRRPATVISTFRFDDEALVEPSILIEEVEAPASTR
jgi:hypothetical protein